MASTVNATIVNRLGMHETKDRIKYDQKVSIAYLDRITTVVALAADKMRKRAFVYRALIWLALCGPLLAAITWLHGRWIPVTMYSNEVEQALWGSHWVWETLALAGLALCFNFALFYQEEAVRQIPSKAHAEAFRKLARVTNRRTQNRPSLRRYTALTVVLMIVTLRNVPVTIDGLGRLNGRHDVGWPAPKIIQPWPGIQSQPKAGSKHKASRRKKADTSTSEQ